jgi:hypothetical protein
VRGSDPVSVVAEGDAAVVEDAARVVWVTAGGCVSQDGGELVRGGGEEAAAATPAAASRLTKTTSVAMLRLRIIDPPL